VVRWSLDKHYLVDLSSCGVPVVDSTFVEPNMDPDPILRTFLAEHPRLRDFVAKPAVGAYSKDVKRYTRGQASEALSHISMLLNENCAVILQPYLPSIDHDGETNLIYFDQVYSHAIRKGALLQEDGTVNPPTYAFRTAREPAAEELATAQAAIDAASAHLSLRHPLHYARVDLIRGENGEPRILELELFEPSLSLPLADGSADRFARALSRLRRPERDMIHAHRN
jgi:O-ureido-D-serine cyclo-ligase